MMFNSISMEKRIRHQLEQRTKEELIAARDNDEMLKTSPMGQDILVLINEILAKKFEEKR